MHLIKPHTKQANLEKSLVVKLGFFNAFLKNIYFRLFWCVFNFQTID